MFRVKVVGHRQIALFELLLALYKKGVTCFLFSPTIDTHLRMPILKTILKLRTNFEMSSLFHDYALDVCQFEKMSMLFDLPVKSIEEFVRIISILEQVQKTRLA